MQKWAKAVRRVSYWWAGALDWIETGLQSYILYEKQRQILKEPLGILWPLSHMFGTFMLP